MVRLIMIISMQVISKERERAVFNKSCRWRLKAFIVSLIVDNVKNVFMQKLSRRANMKRKHGGEDISVLKKRMLGQLQLFQKILPKPSVLLAIYIYTLCIHNI